MDNQVLFCGLVEANHCLIKLLVDGLWANAGGDI